MTTKEPLRLDILKRSLSYPSVLVAALIAVSHGAPALAHTSERAFVLTLPTHLYIAGGAIVVAVSFMIAALVTAERVRSIAAIEWRLGRVPHGVGAAASVVSLAIMTALVGAGFLGTQDPLANPLPLVVWTLWWIGLTAAQVLLGDLWSALNPWRGAHTLLRTVPGLRRIVARPPLRYPDGLGAWPAVAGFLGFAWFELVYAAPQNPEILAKAVAAYFTLHLAGSLLFGLSPWLRNAEAFSVYFRMVSWLSPLNGRPGATSEDGGAIVATLPGLGLLHLRPLGIGGVAFVLLALSSVSFDGLSGTFWWLDLIGTNPLEFPGRSAVTLPNTLGLFGTFVALAAAFAAAVRLGQRMGGDSAPLATRLGESVASIVPIALGYHLAHYATSFMVDAQYAATALSDPFGLGWDAFGLGQVRVTTSFLNDFGSVRAIWHAQVAIIVFAHVAAVAVGHGIAARRTDRHRDAVLGQAPLTVLMVGYTVFGLWLLATPTAA
ncbi:MAG: hypothetical protein WD673_11530 [Alphaproteobacteria bacterium]